MKNSLKSITLTSAVAVALASGAAVADNPFSAKQLDAGYQVAAAEGKCGEGKCGEGKCGGAKETKGKDSEGKCGEGKCGEGKCGGSKETKGKDSEGKCGEGKCGG